MATLDDLRAALFPTARIVPASSAAGTAISPPPDIGWVRVMKARVPAFEGLDPGDLAIVPASALAVVAPGASEVEALVEGLARAHVAGLLLVEGDDDGANGGAGHGPAPIEAAVATAGLPALVLPRTDPNALERTVIGFLVNRRAELDRQAAALEGHLQELALEGGGPAALVAALAGFLGRAVALEGPRGEPLAVHAPSDVPDAPAAVGRYHARPRSAALRVPLPAAAGLTGSLALLGERPISELERIASSRVAGLIALELTREEAVRAAHDSARRGEALPGDGPPWVVLITRQRDPADRDPADAGPAADGTARREAVRREIRQLAPARRMNLRGDVDSLELRAVLAVATDDADGMLLAARIAGFLGRTVAISRPFEAKGDRPAAEAEARATLEAAEGLPDPPRVARADRLSAYRLLVSLHNLSDGPRQARALLEPLLASRPDVRREHLATLRAILEQPGIGEAAAALGVHRNTVAYRVRRIERLTGWRLIDPDLRLPLAVALRLVQDA